MIPALFFGKGIHLAMTAHFAAIVRIYGVPKLQKDWWARVLPDENLHCIAFCLLYLFFNHTAFWLLPEGVMAALTLANLASSYPGLPGFLRNQAVKIRSMEYQLLMMKATIEIYSGIM